jgi:hypothetical protein
MGVGEQKARPVSFYALPCLAPLMTHVEPMWFGEEKGIDMSREPLD